jgi:hypothetical protein
MQAVWHMRELFPSCILNTNEVQLKIATLQKIRAMQLFYELLIWGLDNKKSPNLVFLAFRVFQFGKQAECAHVNSLV